MINNGNLVMIIPEKNTGKRADHNEQKMDVSVNVHISRYLGA